MEPVARDAARRYNKAVSRIGVLTPLMSWEGNYGWKKLVKAGFWDYFVEYRIKSWWTDADEWQKQCHNEALGEISDLIVSESKNIQEDSKRLTALIGETEGEVEVLEAAIRAAKSQLPVYKQRTEKFKQYTANYTDRGLGQETIDARAAEKALDERTKKEEEIMKED